MNYYIGVDLGTSSCKMILCNEENTILNSITKDYPVYYPETGWSEQNPKDWWIAFKDGIKELLKKSDFNKVRSIAVAGQMHSLVILDDNDNVIRPAILWNDGRTFKETEYLNTIIGKDSLSKLTANISFAGFTAPKLLWLKNNELENFNKIKKIMLPKDYLNYCLTGVHSCDYSDASGMLLLDVKNKKWSKEMIEICSIKEEQLPKLFESYEPIGKILPDVAAELGLNSDVVVAAGAGDNASAAIGTKTIGDGKCNISLGTSGTIFISSKEFKVGENNALHSFVHADGNYHLMGCILSAASCNQWFCDKVLNDKNYSELQSKINIEMLGNNNVYFLPYLMGERSPINDIDASGTFIGLRPNSSFKEMLLAVFEGVSFAIRDNLEVAKKLGINISTCTVSGGGAKSKLWLKILSNILNVELLIPETEEGPSLGAVYLAKYAAGDIERLDEEITLSIKEVIKPDVNFVELYEQRYRKFCKIYPAMKQIFKDLK